MDLAFDRVFFTKSCGLLIFQGKGKDEGAQIGWQPLLIYKRDNS
jgi:hypothetical protein